MRAVRWVALAAVAVVGASACSASIDPSPLSEFFDLRVVNDTGQTVKVEPCWDPSCRDRTGMPTSTLEVEGHRDMAPWSNSVGGTVAVAVIRPGSSALKCMVVHYIRGQKKGTVRVSAARACRSGS
jgi:hypothetical protein